MKKTRKNFLKALLYLVMCITPFVLVDQLVTAESLTTYSIFEEWVFRIVSIYIGILYGNGIYSAIYKKSII